MSKLAILTIISIVAAISGCRATYDDHTDYHPAPPELEGFHMVDSYGVSSFENPFVDLALNPYIDSGLFEIFWDVNNESDYTVVISINDIPSLAGGRVIGTDYCGPGLDCDFEGVQFCEYNADFSISCDPPSEEFPGRTLTYFDDLIETIPQTMYFILDVCDTQSDICKFQILDVLME